MKLAVADVETSLLMGGYRPETKFWGLAIEGEDYRRFDTTAELGLFLRQRAGELLVYCHHDFDVLQLLNDGADVTVRDVRSGRVLRAQVEGTEWRNSHALFPSSLKEILAATGQAKPELDELEARNVADTVGALAAFEQLDERYAQSFGVRPLGGTRLTAASVAFAAAESIAGRLPRDLSTREAYRGGRVEAFRVGPCGPARCYDINSSYPAAFLDLPERDELLLLDVEVKTDGPGPLAWADYQDKLLFPQGRFESWCLRSSYERYLQPHAGINAVKIRAKSFFRVRYFLMPSVCPI